MNERKLDIIAQFLRDNEQTTFTFAEAQEWSVENGWSEERPSNVIQGLSRRGFKMVERLLPKRIRTLSSNPHDRWSDPGSKTHGGGGGSAIVGMAGQEG